MRNANGNPKMIMIIIIINEANPYNSLQFSLFIKEFFHSHFLYKSRQHNTLPIACVNETKKRMDLESAIIIDLFFCGGEARGEEINYFQQKKTIQNLRMSKKTKQASHHPLIFPNITILNRKWKKKQKPANKCKNKTHKINRWTTVKHIHPSIDLSTKHTHTHSSLYKQKNFNSFH